ncbi:MAG: ATP-binding protein [Anaerolineae bacterium]
MVSVGRPRAWLRGLDVRVGPAADDYVWPLYSRAVWWLAALLNATTYVWLFVVWTGVEGSRFGLAMLALSAPGSLWLASGAALALRRHPRVGAILLVVGVLACEYAWPSAARGVLAVAGVGVAGLLLGRAGALVTALAGAAIMWPAPEQVLPLGLATAAYWIASGYVSASLQQASDRQRHSVRVENELLGRRAELRRLNDSLRNAYTLLERTNHELAEARDDAEQSKRLKTQFAAAISHELRTPLNLILGFTEVMHTTPESYAGARLDAEIRGDIREIYLNTRHLLELVDDVLDLSRIEQVRLAMVPEETDLEGLIDEALETVAGLYRNRPLVLQRQIEPALPRCTVDRTRIRQVLVNLLTNAARYAVSGEVRVSARVDERLDEIVVAVQDTGPGIAEVERSRIFDAFYQVANPLRRGDSGSGLGLAICRTFVQMHGGRIWLESEEGKGSRFSFTIPLRPPPTSPSEEWRLSAAPDPFADNIVVMDGAGKLARRLERALTGLTVHGVEGMAALKEAVDHWHPKAVVVFEQDDDGGNEEVLDAAAWPGLAVLACSLQNGQPLSEYPMVRGILTKPVSAGALLAALDSVGPVRSLLIADDDGGMTRLVQRTLALHRPDVEVTIAHDGAQAFDRLAEYLPDVMLLDLAMPVVDGRAVLQRLAEREASSPPVLILTATDMHGGQGEMASERIVVSACGGLGEGEVVRYLEAVARAARPQYGNPPKDRP